MIFIPILVILIVLITVAILVYFMGLNKLKDYKTKLDKAENIIDTNLENKLELIISINGIIKKATGKKDYLKDYVSIKDLIITNIEKDMKLEEATKLINNLMLDFSELANDSEFMKKMQNLREIDEVLVSAKNLYNQNAIGNNQLIKSFPYSIIAKIAKYKMITFYDNNNKTEDNDSF